jgi:hypothetical protein
VVNIGPLDTPDVVGEYQVVDTVGLGEVIKNYKSTISIFSSSPLLFQISNLSSIDTLKAFFTFDSTGYVEVNYNPATRMMINGSGNYHCYKTHFNLVYHIEPPVEGELHRATFTKIN